LHIQPLCGSEPRNDSKLKHHHRQYSSWILSAINCPPARVDLRLNLFYFTHS
jgi:hypothetical protein